MSELQQWVILPRTITTATEMSDATYYRCIDADPILTRLRARCKHVEFIENAGPGWPASQDSPDRYYCYQVGKEWAKEDTTIVWRKR